jgi:hypothetical protein
LELEVVGIIVIKASYQLIDPCIITKKDQHNNHFMASSKAFTISLGLLMIQPLTFQKGWASIKPFPFIVASFLVVTSCLGQKPILIRT